MRLVINRTIKILEKIYDGLLAGLVYVAAVLILFMVLCISASVFLRHTEYAFGWQLEASEYILIIITFFGTGWLLKTGGHIRVDIIPNWVKGKRQAFYNGSTYIIVSIVCLAFTITGVFTAWDAYIAGTLQIKIYTFPKWILISLIPLGGFFLFVESGKLAYRCFSRKVILIVDDEADVLTTLDEILGLGHYRVDTAQDFDTASEKLKYNVYDGVVLDIMGVQGFDLLRMSVEKGCPTIMLTAHALHPAALKKCMELGAISFVPKEKMESITSFVDDALTMSEKEARLNFYLKLGGYFDHRFGPGWDKDEAFWSEARKVLSGNAT